MVQIHKQWIPVWKIIKKKKFNQSNKNHNKISTGIILKTFSKTKKIMIKILCKVKFKTLFKLVQWVCYLQKLTLNKRGIINYFGTMKQTHNKVINRKIMNHQKCWYVVWMSLVTLIINKKRSKMIKINENDLILIFLLIFVTINKIFIFIM